MVDISATCNVKFVSNFMKKKLMPLRIFVLKFFVSKCRKLAGEAAASLHGASYISGWPFDITYWAQCKNMA